MPAASTTDAADASDGPGPVQFDPGYSPWKDPTVLTLLAISIVAALLFVGGTTIGPALGDDDGGGVFPIVDILLGGDGGDDGALTLDANRSSLTVGDAVAFTVRGANDTPASDATVAIAGRERAVDENGRVVLSLDRVGSLTATATAPGPNDTTIESNEVALDVAPRTVALGVQANRSVATAGEPIGLTLIRSDSGAAVRGSLAAAVLPDDAAPALSNAAGDVRREDGVQLVLRPERAGQLLVVGSRPDGGGETFVDPNRTIDVERRSVPLTVSVEPDAVETGEAARVTVRRADTGGRVAATLSVGDRTVATGADGRAEIAFDEAGERTVEATASPTPAVRFGSDDATLTVRRRPVELAIAVDRTAITTDGEVAVAVTRADTGDPIAATVSVAGRTLATGPDGRVTTSIAADGEQPIVASADATPAERFLEATGNVTVANATFALGDLHVPETVQPGARVNASILVHNRGPEAGADTIAIESDGEAIASSVVDLSPGETRTVGFETTAPATSGEWPLTIRGSDGSASAVVAVED